MRGWPRDLRSTCLLVPVSCLGIFIGQFGAMAANCKGSLKEISASLKKINAFEHEFNSEAKAQENPSKFKLENSSGYQEFRKLQARLIRSLAIRLQKLGVQFVVKPNALNLPTIEILEGNTWLGRVSSGARRNIDELKLVYDPSALFLGGISIGAVFDPSHTRISLPHESLLRPNEISALTLHELRHAFVDSIAAHELKGLISGIPLPSQPPAQSQIPKNVLLDRSGYSIFQHFDEATAFLTQAIAHKAKFRALSQSGKKSRAALEKIGFDFAKSLSIAASQRDSEVFTAALELIWKAQEGDTEAQSRIKLFASGEELKATLTLIYDSKNYQVEINFSNRSDSHNLFPPITEESLKDLEDQVYLAFDVAKKTGSQAKRLKF